MFKFTKEDENLARKGQLLVEGKTFPLYGIKLIRKTKVAGSNTEIVLLDGSKHFCLEIAGFVNSRWQQAQTVYQEILLQKEGD